MSPLGIIKYVIAAGMLVISLFVGLRLLLAHDVRREMWRASAKRYVYMTRPRFKMTTILVGWVFLLLGLYLSWLQIDAIVNPEP